MSADLTSDEELRLERLIAAPPHTVQSAAGAFLREEFPRGCRSDRRGPQPCRLLRAPREAAELRQHHAAACYARGLDTLNAAYHYLDLLPKGRDEADLPHGMAWVRLHDEYAKS